MKAGIDWMWPVPVPIGVLTCIHTNIYKRTCILTVRFFRFELNLKLLSGATLTNSYTKCKLNVCVCILYQKTNLFKMCKPLKNSLE